MKTSSSFRRNIANVVFASRMDRLSTKILASRGVIVALHRLTARYAANSTSGLNVGLDEFGSCLDFLADNGFEIVTMREAMLRLDRPSAEAKFAVLTFDDGYRDNHSLLFPELLRRQIPAHVYLTTGFIDRTAPMWWYGIDALLEEHGAVVFNGEEIEDFALLNDKIIAAEPIHLMRLLGTVQSRYKIDFRDYTDLHAMDWPMVREMADSGIVGIGSHGVSHLPLSRLPADMAKQEMQRSTERAAENIGRPVVDFAFPYGDRCSVSAREVAAAKDYGFATAATSISGLVRSNAINRHALRRVVLGGTGMVDRLRASISGMVGDPPLAGPA